MADVTMFKFPTTNKTNIISVLLQYICVLEHILQTISSNVLIQTNNLASSFLNKTAQLKINAFICGIINQKIR